jgi:hypothetical protein
MQAGNEVRLADYGPAGLDAGTSAVLGNAVQLVARSAFPGAVRIAACTSEPGALAGLVKSGLRLRQEKPICVLKLNGDLDTVSHYRLTLMDWDKLFEVEATSAKQHYLQRPDQLRFAGGTLLAQKELSSEQTRNAAW